MAGVKKAKKKNLNNPPDSKDVNFPKPSPPLAGGTGGLHGPGLCMKPDRAVKSVPARLWISKAVSVTERLDRPPHERGKGSGSGRDKKRSGAADLEIHQGSTPQGEPSLDVFGGVVCKGKPKPASLGDRANAFGSLMGFMKLEWSRRSGAECPRE
jgi:hypothetical protein